MRKVPKSTLANEARDTAECRLAVESALSQAEPKQAFDRHSWLKNTKHQLKKQYSSSNTHE